MPRSQERRRENELKSRHGKCCWCGWIVDVLIVFYSFITSCLKSLLSLLIGSSWFSLEFLSLFPCFSLRSFVACGCFKTVWGWMKRQNLVHGILQSNLGLFKLYIGLLKLDIWSAPVWYTEIYFLCGWSLQYSRLSMNWWEEEILVSWRPSKLIQCEDFATKLRCRSLLFSFSFFLS